ncbi:protein fem-1 homolog B-like [Stylophora pistillata]|uniref:protein fem-1 homolog B-like n=1 Tax=Stylophora pistillata TaxID=50429 RepID=UPI000C03EEA3|nr:protein fem-1 homolog B-like [Stylophora pistillata]
MFGFFRKDYECEKANIEARGKIKIKGEVVNGCTALWTAAAKGHLDVVRLKIEQNAEVDGRTSTNSTPLRAAAFVGHLDIVRFLVENEADVNARNDFNSTLMIAWYRGYMDVVSFLVEHGSNIHQEDNDGDTCLHLAAEGGHFQIVECTKEVRINALKLLGATIASDPADAYDNEKGFSLTKRGI